MLARFESLSLRTKLILGFVALIGLMLVGNGAALLGHRYSLAAMDGFLDRDNRVAELSLDSKVAMGQARRYEKEFLLKVGDFGYEETKSRYTTLVRTRLATLRENMAVIRSLTDSPDTAQQTRTIEEIAGRYEAGFLEVVKLYGRRGRVDTGTEGQLRARAQAIEELLRQGGPERLMSDLLTLRRAEKDFILRDSSRYADAFEAFAERYKKDVARTGLPAQRKNELQQLGEQYLGLFRAYVALAARIDAGSQAYLEEVLRIEPLLEQLQVHTAQAATTTRHTLHRLNTVTTWTVVIVNLIAILLGLLVATFIIRNLNRSVGSCVDFAGRLAGGDWTAQLPPVAGHNEFGRLARAMNQMAESIESSRVLLKLTQNQLVAAARQAGMAEIANNVLHNVGNVLNSVNVSASLVNSKIRNSKAAGLAKAVQLMNQHAADLGDFLTHDEKGKVLPGYLNKLVAALAAEQRSIIEELGSLTKSVDHIKEIVATQQSYAGAASVVEAVQVRDVLEDALRMHAGALTRHQVTVVREFADVPLLPLDQHRLLQILLNLIGNAKQAMDGVLDRLHRITLRVDIADGADGRRLRICVEDEGEGIASENLARLFAHGFTTRKNGHGFGLHSCALAAREMGGTLVAHSDGPGKGATFTLELPIKLVEDPQ